MFESLRIFRFDIESDLESKNRKARIPVASSTPYQITS